jgi:hemophore-related protein
MSLNVRLARRANMGAIGTGVALTALLTLAAPASADPAPNCTAADRAGVRAGVQAGMSAYLFTHPDVNGFLTGLVGQPVDQVPTEVQDYLNANPQVKDEVGAIRQPLADLRERCGVYQGDA